MRVTVLGCSGTFPGPDSPCSGYFLESAGYRLVVDLGAGASGPLQRHIDLLDIDAVYVSHLHADHCIDLVALSYARRYHPRGVPPRLPVYGPPGTARRVRQAFESPPVDGLLDGYDFHEVSAGTLTLGPFSVRTAVMTHPVECHGLRVEADGRTLAYSGDTGSCDALVELARDVDLFLCEASWPSTPEPPAGMHLTGREAGEHARRAGARRLVLTHVLPFHDPAVLPAEARQTYGGPVELAACGVVYELDCAAGPGH